MGFVEEEAAWLARREEERLRELGADVEEQPRWRWSRRPVRAEPSGNVYSVLTSASRTDVGPDPGWLGYVEVSAPGVGGLGRRLRAHFEVTPGASARLPRQSASRAGRSRLRAGLAAWPRSGKLLIAASITLIAVASILMPVTTELGRPDYCEGTHVSSRVAFVSLSLAYLALAAIPVLLWRSGLAGSRPMRVTVFLVTLWIGLLTYFIPTGGVWATFYLVLSSPAWGAALLASALDARSRPNATPGLLPAVTALALAYYGLVYLVSPHPVMC